MHRGDDQFPLCVHLEPPGCSERAFDVLGFGHRNERLQRLRGVRVERLGPQSLLPYIHATDEIKSPEPATL